MKETSYQNCVTKITDSAAATEGVESSFLIYFVFKMLFSDLLIDYTKRLIDHYLRYQNILHQYDYMCLLKCSDLDAIGKPQSGLFLGNIGWLGSYSECTKSIVDAHYCLAYVTMPALNITEVSKLT